MKNRLILGAVLICSLFAATAPVAKAQGLPVSVNLNVDVNKLIEQSEQRQRDVFNAILNIVDGNNRRDQYVRFLINDLHFNQTNQQFNIMIFKDGLGDFDLVGGPTARFARKDFAGVTYQVWVFSGPARFVNRGDGGFLNFAFAGNFRRTGGRGEVVEFGPSRAAQEAAAAGGAAPADDGDDASARLLKAEGPAVKASRPKAGGSPAKGGTKAPAAGKPGTVTKKALPAVRVARGDTLPSIAKARLGNASRWREIYRLNQGRIGSDPNRLQPGMVLLLPSR